jgi:hypothetical protein
MAQDKKSSSGSTGQQNTSQQNTSQQNKGQQNAGQQNEGQQNEGEGNRTAARKYDEEQRRFAQSGKVDKAAHDAEAAVEGNEKAELEKAEAEGKRHAHGEDPDVKR